MHMPDVLVAHPAVFATTAVVAGGAVGFASLRLRRGLDERGVPLLGVLGAFVFAAQMVNFALPGLATSGHLGGAALLTTLFGPAAAILVMTAVLFIQCLLFQDGGLLALGANVLTLGVLPALVTAGCLRLSARLIGGRLAAFVGSALGAWLGLLGGAALVPLLAAASGSLPSPAALPTFVGLMLGLHALIGVGEVAITLAVLALLTVSRPELVQALRPAAAVAATPRFGRALFVGLGLTVSLAIGGGLSQLASTAPDGLEAAMAEAGLAEAAAGGASLAPGAASAVVAARDIVAKTAFMADYEAFPGLAAGPLAATLAGMAGTFGSFLLVYTVAWLVHRRLRRRLPAPG